MKLLILICSLWAVALSQHHSTTQHQNPAQSSTYGVKTAGQHTSGHGYSSQSAHPDGTHSSQYTYQTADAGTGTQTGAAATGQQAVDQQTQVVADTQYAASQPEVQPAAEAAAVDAAGQQGTAVEAQANSANAPQYDVQQHTQTVDQQSASNYPSTYTSGSSQTTSNTYQTPLTYQIVSGGGSGGSGYSFGSESSSTGTQFGFPVKKTPCQLGQTGSTPCRTSQTSSTTHFQIPTFQYIPAKTGATQTTSHTQTQYPTVFQEVPSVVSGGSSSGSGSSQTTSTTQVQYPSLAQDFPQLFSGGAAATGSGSSQSAGTIHAQYPTFQYVPAKPATSQTTTHTQAQYPTVVVSGGNAGSGSSQTTTTQTQYPGSFQYVPVKPSTSQTTTHTQAQYPTIVQDVPVVSGGSVGSGSGQTTTTHTQYPGTFQYVPVKPATSQTTTHNQYPGVVPVVVSGGGAGSQTTTTTQTQYPGTFNVVSGGGQGSTSGSGQTQFVVVSGGGSSGSVGGAQRPTYVVYPGSTSHTAQGFYPGSRPSVFFGGCTSRGGCTSQGGQTQFSYYPQYYPQSHYFLPNHHYFIRPVTGGVHQPGAISGATVLPANVTPAPVTTVQSTVQAVLGQHGSVVPTRGRPTVQVQPARPSYVSHGHQFVSSGPTNTVVTRPVTYQQPTQYYQHPHNHHYQYQFPGQNVVSYVNTYPASTSSQTLGSVSGSANTTPFRASSEKGSTYTSYSAARPSSQAYSYASPYSGGGMSARYAYRVPVQGAMVV